jgi:hypothetical protein
MIIAFDRFEAREHTRGRGWDCRLGFDKDVIGSPARPQIRHSGYVPNALSGQPREEDREAIV